jgi:hypothetical protein
MSDREAQFREMARKRIVYQLPGMEAVPVQRDQPYRGADDDPLLMDIYTPGPKTGQSAPPVVVIAGGYPDPAGAFRAVGWHVSWAQLLACSGIAAVICASRQPAADILAAIGHLDEHASTLGLGANRMGILASSGHGPVALSAAIANRRLRCAALLYSFTMDLGESRHVAAAAGQFGFANPCADKSIDDLPSDMPLLFARAGRDQFAGLNDALDRLVAAGLSKNLPITLVNHPTGVHAFDLEENTRVSRGIIRQVLAFLRGHLEVE